MLRRISRVLDAVGRLVRAAVLGELVERTVPMTVWLGRER